MGIISDRFKATLDAMQQADERLLQDLDQLISDIRNTTAELEAWMQEEVVEG